MLRNIKAISMTVVLAAALCGPRTASAQSVVVTGTGDPTVDIPAVQGAVDQGGQVVLMGHFSFAAPANKPDGQTYNRMVTVSKQVAIWGRLTQTATSQRFRADSFPSSLQPQVNPLHFKDCASFARRSLRSGCLPPAGW